MSQEELVQLRTLLKKAMLTLDNLDIWGKISEDMEATYKHLFIKEVCNDLRNADKQKT